MAIMLLVVTMIVLMLVRVPVAFALLLPSFGYLLWADIDLGIAVQRMIAGIDSFVLLAVPLFTLAGLLMNTAGIADRIFKCVESCIGHVRGSLGYVNIAGSVIFSGMSGSAVVDAAGLGVIEIRAMREHGYDDEFSVGITAASSTIGPIIPPSIPGVVYAVTAGVSVGGLFMAGVIPGLVMALTLAAAVWLYSRRRNMPSLARVGWRDRGRSLLLALPALMTPAVILVGITSGYFTPTEASALAVMYSIVVGALVYREFKLPMLGRLAVETAGTTASILLIVASSSVFAWILALEGAPQLLAEKFLGFSQEPVVFLLMVNLLLLIVGCVLEPVSAILILVPVLQPLVGVFGIDPIHFGLIVLLNLMIGLLTPPVGLVLYVLQRVSGLPMSTVVKGTVVFIPPLIVALGLVTFVPALSLWLPRALGY